jgi:glycosyltransferase involved in cell wall biosynthesis
MVIDIIVPTYRRPQILPEALESLLAQTYGHWECWIAEDGQSQETHAAVAPFLKDRRFHYLPGPHSGAPGTPRNRALLAGHGHCIAFLDDDDIWLPEKLEKQMAFLNDHPDCVLLGSNALVMREGQNRREDVLPRYFQKAPFGQVAYKQLVKDDCFINSSVVIRRWALQFSGLQNETLHKGEDYDLWLRIGPLGEIWLMEAPLVIYRKFSLKHSTSQESASERRQEAYHVRFKIYNSALEGIGEMPSPLLFPENDRQEHLCRNERNFCAAGPKFLGRMRHDIGSALSDFLYLRPSKQKQQDKAIRVFAQYKARWKKLGTPSTLECIIFSKDRALQLHGLLTTLREKVSPAMPVHVLYRTSSHSHQNAYEEIIGVFAKQKIRFIRQTGDRSFRHDLLKILFSLTCDMLFFLVDDMVFTEPLDIHDLLRFDPDMFVASLRMGENLTRCYVQQTSQSLPPFLNNLVRENDKIVWQWNQGELDWGYPLSVDGHFFARREIAAMAALIPFGAPNSFEDQLQIFKPFFHDRYGIGYKKSKVVNIPCNRVQTEIDNISGTTHPDELLSQWFQGYRMDYEKLYGLVNESAHQEVPMPLTLRV